MVCEWEVADLMIKVSFRGASSKPHVIMNHAKWLLLSIPT